MLILKSVSWKGKNITIFEFYSFYACIYPLYRKKWIPHICEGIHQITLHRLDKGRRLELVEDFYDNVNANIRHFLKDKEKVLTIHLEQIQDEFPIFWKQIGAEGDLAKALETFMIRHHSTKTGWHKQFMHELKYRMMRLKRRIF